MEFDFLDACARGWIDQENATILEGEETFSGTKLSFSGLQFLISEFQRSFPFETSQATIRFAVATFGAPAGVSFGS